MLGTLALAGIGCALMSNPRRKSRRKTKARRRNPVNLGRVQFRHGQVGGPYYTATATLDGKQYDGYAPGKLGRKKARAHLLAEARKHFSSNPSRRRAKKRNPAKRRRTTKRRSKSVSPGSAASRLAHWRWHRNPKPRGLTTTTHRRGDVDVIINRWRNANSTAFISVETSGPRGVKVWEAKSQGPSAGGYSKPTQAAERVYKKITGEWASWGGENLDKIADAAAAAVSTKSNPRRRKSRRNPRVAKTKKVYVIQGNYGYGWDDEAEEDTWKEAREQLKTYRANGGGSYRCITRREKLQANPRRRSKRRAR